VPVIQVDDKELISFSEQAPVFLEIKGKNLGDSLTVGNDTLKILTFS
jgi:hypothetical protein